MYLTCGIPISPSGGNIGGLLALHEVGTERALSALCLSDEILAGELSLVPHLTERNCSGDIGGGKGCPIRGKPWL
jgi:hypothetical protein